jgi:hypothetical protein
MGSGRRADRIDLPAYQNLCASARNAKVRRLLYMSFRGMDSDALVDIFRVKWCIEDAIRRSGVPTSCSGRRLHGRLGRSADRRRHSEKGQSHDLW